MLWQGPVRVLIYIHKHNITGPEPVSFGQKMEMQSPERLACNFTTLFIESLSTELKSCQFLPRLTSVKLP